MGVLQIMACLLFGAKLLSASMLPYCQLDTKEHISNHQLRWKCCLWSLYILVLILLLSTTTTILLCMWVGTFFETSLRMLNYCHQRHKCLPTGKRMNHKAALNHCGLVMPHDDVHLVPHWSRWWLNAWRHQAMIWTNIDLSSLRSSDVHLRENFTKDTSAIGHSN